MRLTLDLAAMPRPTTRSSLGRFVVIAFCCLNSRPPTVEPSSDFDRIVFKSNVNQPIGNSHDVGTPDEGVDNNGGPTADSFGWSISNNVVDFDVGFPESEDGIRVVEIRDILREKLLLKFPRIFRSGNEEAAGSAGDLGESANFSLEMIRFTYLPMVFSRGVRQRVALSAQHLNVGSRIDSNVTSEVDSKTTCLSKDGCVYDRLVSFAFDDTRSPVRWPSQLRAAFNPLSVFPSDSRVVKVQLCANKEAWRLWQGYVPCVSASFQPWFWTSLSEKSQWRDGLNCGGGGGGGGKGGNSGGSSVGEGDGGDQFCCICAPDAGDDAPICDDFDLGAQVRKFASSSRCSDDRRLGPRGTFGVCPYKCACGRTGVMRRRCRISLRDEMTEEWTAKLLKETRRDGESLWNSGRDGVRNSAGSFSVKLVAIGNTLALAIFKFAP